MARILVIEDNDAVRETFEIILQSAGHDLVVAKDGRDGLERLVSDPFDLVLTDIMMPKQGGVEVINQMRQSGHSAAILVVSGGARSARVDYLDLAKQLGADAVMAKPVKTLELLEMVDLLLVSRAG